VSAGEDGEADAVDVLLNGGGDDHLRGLAEAGVDDLHAGVAEGSGDDFGAAVVAVEAGFGDQDTDWRGRRHRVVSIAGGEGMGYPPPPLGYFVRKCFFMFGLQGGCSCKILILFWLWLKYL